MAVSGAGCHCQEISIVPLPVLKPPPGKFVDRHGWDEFFPGGHGISAVDSKMSRYRDRSGVEHATRARWRTLTGVGDSEDGFSSDIAHRAAGHSHRSDVQQLMRDDAKRCV